jgi:hypothetical protein
VEKLAYEPDFYMSESLKKGPGLFNIPAPIGFSPGEPGPNDAAAAHDHEHMDHDDMRDYMAGFLPTICITTIESRITQDHQGGTHEGRR